MSGQRDIELDRENNERNFKVLSEYLAEQIYDGVFDKGERGMDDAEVWVEVL